MRRLLHAIFNEPIPLDVCVQIREHGFDGVRIDAQQIETVEAMAAVLVPVLAADLWPLVIVSDGRTCAWLPRGTAIELRNEPDLEGPDPVRYRQLLLGMREIEAHFGLELWAPAISNLVDRGFHYLRAIRDDLPDRVSIHWYPHRPWLPTQGHEGRTREEEVALLRQIIGDRVFGVSEVGYHTAPVCAGWWVFRRCRRITDAYAAQAIDAEYDFWEAQGAQFVTRYQLNDGPTDTPLDRYGLRTVDGHWKPHDDGPAVQLTKG